MKSVVSRITVALACAAALLIPVGTAVAATGTATAASGHSASDPAPDATPIEYGI